MSAIDQAQEEVKPDMTPMIDVVFLMIIFFICIDFKVLEAKLPAYLPKDKGSQATKVEPQEQLSVKIRVRKQGTPVFPEANGGVGRINPHTQRPYRFVLTGHDVMWEVGAKPVNSVEELTSELKRIYADKSLWQPDKDHPGQLKPMPVVIEPHPGTYYNDAAITADAVKEAKFQEINFGGGLGAAPVAQGK